MPRSSPSSLPGLRATRLGLGIALTAGVWLGGAEAATAAYTPFSTTFDNTCTLAPQGATSGPTTVFAAKVTTAGSTPTLTEGDGTPVVGSTLTFTPDAAGRAALIATGAPWLKVSARADLTGSADRSYPLIARSPAAGPLSSATPSYVFVEPAPIVLPYLVPIDGPSLSLTYTGFSGALRVSSSATDSPYALVCTPAPAQELTILRADVAARPSDVAPRVTDLSARSGNGVGGDRIQIIGQFPGTVTGVSFGAVPATSFRKVTYRVVEAVVPRLGLGAAPENVRVAVSNAAGTSSDTTGDDFDYLLPTGTPVHTYTSMCGLPNHPVFPVTTRLAFSGLAALPTGGTSIAPSVKTTLTIGPDFAADARARVIYSLDGFIVRSVSQTLKVSGGGSSGSLEYASEVSRGFHSLTSRAPIALDAPDAGFAPATGSAIIGSTGGSKVIFTPQPFVVRAELRGSDRLDGLGIIGTFDLACAPGPDSALSLTVSGPQTTTPDPTTPDPTTPDPTTPDPTTPDPTTPDPTTPDPTTPDATTPRPPLSLRYALGGTATVKTLVRGALPINGSLAADVDTAAGTFTGDLTLQGTAGKMIALGFLGVVAKFDLVPQGPVTGQLADGVLTANAKIRIKLPSFTLLGLQLSGGSTCQTRLPSNIALRSTGGAFDPAVGGTLAGTFAISDLTGCGNLGGIISSLTAGKGNALAIKLTPQR